MVTPLPSNDFMKWIDEKVMKTLYRRKKYE